jgi:pimeloyl-ACP methyl ester carboxylesterase
MRKGQPFVLVHGAWHGGWCWHRVRQHLEAAHARVYAPTLTGLGERSHLREPVPSLAQHIEDVLRVLEWEELEDVVLVGHSLAGMVISGVADRAGERLRRLVYLDAAVPRDGDDFASHVPGITPEQVLRRRDAFRRLAPDGMWIPPPAPEIVGVTDPSDVAWLKRRLTAHPLRTWLDPVHLPLGKARGIPKTYILATRPPNALMGYPLHGEAAKRGGEWTYREIACGHDMMIVDAAGTAELLLEAA